ncbi:MAG: hypothetical protein ACRENU_10505 [Gemmatimonadaceae bacterium]
MRINTRFLKIAASVAAVGAFAAIALKLATGPLYARYDANECREAYSKALTRADTARVDLHPYGRGGDSQKHRCGEVRSVVVATDSVMPRDTICLAGRIGLPCRP